VEEVAPLKEQLDEKYKFLADAPQRDPDGNPAMIRYARKTKQQYVMTDVEGKPTGWRAFYKDGKWVVDQAPAKAAAKGGRKKKAAASAKKGRARTKKKAAAKKRAAKKGAAKKAAAKQDGAKKTPARKASAAKKAASRKLAGSRK
jgi:DNA topoisomerase-1